MKDPGSLKKCFGWTNSSNQNARKHFGPLSPYPEFLGIKIDLTKVEFGGRQFGKNNDFLSKMEEYCVKQSTSNWYKTGSFIPKFTLDDLKLEFDEVVFGVKAQRKHLYKVGTEIFDTRSEKTLVITSLIPIMNGEEPRYYARFKGVVGCSHIVKENEIQLEDE